MEQVSGFAVDIGKMSLQRRQSPFFPDCGVDIMIDNAAFKRLIRRHSISLFWIVQKKYINVLGTISLTRLLAPFTLKQDCGHFVMMSSAAGKTPAPGQAVDSASKFALNGYFHSIPSELCQKGIKVTVVFPGPIDTWNNLQEGRKRLSTERCVELTIIAAPHGLKEGWISTKSSPVLAVRYLVQYTPTVGFWLMDKVGKNRVDAAAKKSCVYSLSLLFGNKKAS
ncbi:hypothetical protein SAY86_011669 [Trapa natans]|uniref:Uncharacterized protein n=1 Tax=Trapa natans TaxID=22666 RepID=A0AAN7LZN4_TRANT|nr:hypothetical protein SAY86_011669 [Trapa natans]